MAWAERGGRVCQHCGEWETACCLRLEAANAEIAALKAELTLVKCGEPNYPDRAYAMKGWLKTFGFQVYATLKHGDVGYVLSLLQSGDISKGKAAEAIAELLVGNEPPLPQLIDDTFGEGDLPREIVATLRTVLRETREALHAALVAMQRGLDEGCVDHLDCCEDGGAFWYVAVEGARAVLAKYAGLVEGGE